MLDLTGEAGLFAGRQLAELGADVIRIEPPGGDASRHRSPFLQDRPGLERSLYHLHFNAGKRGIVLDLEKAAGASKLRRLARTADVLVETFAPGRLDALGLGYEALAAENPSLIYTTITPFGQHGPQRGYRGNDLIGAAASGLMYLNGFEVDAPNVPGAEQAYHMASVAAVAGSLTALARRDRGRRGGRVDVSLQEAASMATVQTANANYYTWHGKIIRRRKLPPEGRGPYGIYLCSDRLWLNFTVPIGAPHLWDSFVDWLRAEGIGTSIWEERWRDQAYRVAHPAEIAKAITELCARHTRAETVREGQRRRLLVMPLNTAADLAADEQLWARRFFVAHDHPEAETQLLDTGTPFRFSATPASVPRRAPLLGEHTDEVLGTLDGHAAAAVASPAADDVSRPVAAPPPEGHGGRTLPLAGLRVLDFFWMIAGPATSRVLADFGAEVIKVESEVRVDNIRNGGLQPFEPGTIDLDGIFHDVNSNKRSITLNLNTARGIEIAKELAARSDIVTNNFTGDRMERWGLGYDELRKVKPDLIMLSMPVMGTTGPHRRYGAYGNGVIAFGGMNMNMGRPDRPPVGMAPLYSDFSSPYFAVSALMAALHHRRRTGEGQFIDLAQAETTVALLGTGILEWTANGRLPERTGNRVPDYAPHGAYRCRGEDRWCAIAVRGDEDWQRLCEAIGLPDLATDPRFLSHEARKANEDELDAVIEAWTRERNAWEAMGELQAAGVMGAVVEDLEDMVRRDPWLPGNHLRGLTHPDAPGVTFTTHAQPIRLDGDPPPLRRGPRFGEDNDYVFKELLGIDDDEYVGLMTDGVIY